VTGVLGSRPVESKRYCDVRWIGDHQALEQSHAGVRAALMLASLLDAADEHDGRDACLRHLQTVLHPWLSEEQRQALAATRGATY
jgi:hypothetical protein